MRRVIGCSIIALVASSISYANIYQIPLDVNGCYEFSDSVWINLDLGTSFQKINDVRFNCSGDILAMDAPGLFEFTFIAGTAQWMHAYTDVVDLNINYVPFTNNNISFLSSNYATWDFLLDGKASAYVRVITNLMYIPEDPPTGIYGHIYSASLTIDADPAALPEPASLLLLAAGGLILRRQKK